ncbi:MAG: hypothetical protein ACXABY_03520 [Candidatus Thorarchaeota archaeon]|jgi:hypothetical protein
MANKEQLEYVFKQLDYRPTPAQWEVHESTSRTRLVAGGERSGKSTSAAKDLLGRFYEGKLYWLVAADYERTRAEYDYICDGLAKLGVHFEATKRVDPGEILIEGGFRIATKSAKDPRRLAMEAPDGILGCEASQLDYETYLRLRGRIAEKRGWMLLSGTFESSLGWYVEAFQRGQTSNDEDMTSFSLPTWSNIVVFPGGRDDPEIKKLEHMSSKEWFMERFGGVPSPPSGLVFTEFSNVVHTGMGKDYEFNPTEEVYLFVDPGYAEAYAVEVAQKRGEHLWVVDEVYEKGLVTSDIIKICKQKPWWNKVIGGAVDIAAKQHQAMPAPVEVWRKEAGVNLRSKRLLIRDGIERVKTYLIVNPLTGSPLLHINTRCKGLLSEMGGCNNPIHGGTSVYRWKEDREGRVVGEIPEDKNNHACKALAYGLVDLFGYSARRQRAPIKFF